MRAVRVQPTGIERTFREDELIVTKTDPRGVITYCNDVFLRVAALAEARAVGQPHNIIRHPDMPRAVFKLMWDTLKQRQEIFAYVLNLAADGAHYWVFAHITPSYDADRNVVGYHSNRRLPSREAVGEIHILYQKILEQERRHSTGDAAVAAGSRALQEALSDVGLQYDEFVWVLTNRHTH
ncbi:PAS domain-containing protein [Actinoplanes sp. NPDC024001]|uniref:PAS domain-containing protein n=1 Tax=unclassified Actinoplanes TaxID=2626549 RepID=UPI002E221F30